MSDGPTQRHGDAGLPVRALQATVVAGPGQGRTVTADSDCLTVGSASDNDLQIDDPTVSRFHLELRSAPGGILVRDGGSTNGTQLQGVQLQRAIVPAGTTLTLGRAQLKVGEGDEVRLELHPDDHLQGLWGGSAVMRRLMAQVQRVAASNVAVLVTGESGTGKEVVARSLHALGERRDKPMVTVDCGSLTPTLVASELFGHEKGAFTGADRQHIGAFERADGGTLLLDEIGELPPSLQPALLGVLERRRFRRLGGKQEVSVDVRVISATHRDLREEVNAGTFRLDLYYRLAVLRLSVPPLRERRDDVPLLVAQFLREAGHDGPVEQLISPPAMETLCQHRWPGNVRELRNLIEATLAMGEPPELDDHPSSAAAAAGDVIEPLLDLTYKDARAQLLGEFEQRYLTRLMDRTRGNVSKASREARMDRSHLNDLLRRHGLR